MGYSLVTTTKQYLLMDERVNKAVLTLGLDLDKRSSKLSVPSWHPEGGLLCTGSAEEGAINIWDVRWSWIRHDNNRRPGSGVVTGDVDFDSVVIPGQQAPVHPIYRKPTWPLAYRNMAGGPSQVVNVGGKRVVQACFHPTKNVMMVLNADCHLSFM
jgi:hypothetical protein